MNEEKVQHTPTPWIQYGKEILGPSREYIAQLQRPANVANANAEFIIRAVNSHDMLLQIVKDFSSFLQESYDEDNILMMEAVNKAITQAEGKQFTRNSLNSH